MAAASATLWKKQTHGQKTVGSFSLQPSEPQQLTHTLDQTQVLLRLAEEAADVHDADRAVHAAANPVPVLVPLRQPVPEDLEGLPHRLLTHWTNRRFECVRKGPDGATGQRAVSPD